MSFEEWTACMLGKLLKHKKGFAFKSKDLVDKGHPVVKVSNFTKDSVSLNNCTYISNSEAIKYSEFILKKDDVVIATVGSWPNNPNSIVGKVIKVPTEAEGALLNQNAVILRGNNIDQTFLYYRLKCRDFSDYLMSGARGSANQASITLEHIFKFSFLLPGMNLQKRIAAILLSLDDKIELNRQTNQTLQAIAQALFKEWFVDYNFPGASGEMQDSELGEIPRGWKVGKMMDVLSVKGGATPSTKVAEYWDGEFNWATPKDLSNLKSPVLLSTERKLTDKGVKQISSRILSEGTLLLSSRAPIGYLAITAIPVSINQGFIAINGKELPNLYLLFWLKQHTEKVISRANGSTFLEISKAAFKEIEIIIPPAEVVDIFDNVATPIFEKIKNNEKQNQFLIQLRDTLLPRLMKGEINI